MNIPSLVKPLANYAYKLAKEPGKMLLLVGVFGWILSSLAQVAAVVFNDKIPKDQKRFLIPQELADATVNILAFYTLTKACTKLGEHFVKSGKLATKELKNLYDQKIINGKSINSLMQSTKDFDISSLKQITDKSHPEYNHKFSETYFKFADGISFVSSVAGSIISCNIVTPIFRNKIGANRQKHYMAQDKKQLEYIEPYSPILPMHNKSGIDAYKSKTSRPPSGPMKV